MGATENDMVAWHQRLNGHEFDCRQEKGLQRIRWLYGITDSKDMSLSKIRETVKDMEA